MDVRELVRAGGLLDGEHALIVMLSGGRDSVCLLDVAVELCRPGCVRALHVNYRLRAESDADQAHCERLCEQLGVALEVLLPAREPGNVQAWARQVRYDAAQALAE